MIKYKIRCSDCLLTDSPVPYHADLRPKKVDSFVKKYLKRNGTAFNPVMDRRQMNIAGRILDPLDPLAQLWQNALTASKGKSGLDPAEVIELVQRAIALTGNANFCALVDRRKGLLAKVSSDSLDLIEDQSLFSPGSTDLFGKKFKKSFLKELKLSKELDSLVGRQRYHGNPNKQKLFRFQPGKGPGFNPRTWSQRYQNRVRKAKSKRYANSSISNTCTSRAKRSETGRQCAFATFESFKNRFSGYFTSAKSRRTTASLPSKLEADYFRSRYSNDGCGVQAPVHVASASSLSENGFDCFSARIRENRLRGGPPSRKRSFTRCMPSSRSVCQQSIFSSKTRRKLPSCYKLKDLNVFLQYDHFKMEGIHLLRDMLQPNDWLGKIDLKDAYFVIPIWRDHRKYLRFVWRQTLLEFACLPFGLAVAPRVFTKIMKPVVSLLRRTGIRLIIYLDDILLMNASETGLQQDMHTAQHLLENLGFVVNLEKS